MCNATTVHVSVDDKQYTDYCEAYDVYNQEDLEKAILGFMKDAMGIELEERETRKVDIDVDTVQSGDFIGTMRTDGLGLII